METKDGVQVCMSSYIEVTLKLYGKHVRVFVGPARQNLFTVDLESKLPVDHAKFHSIVAKLLYLRKRGRPDILMSVQ